MSIESSIQGVLERVASAARKTGRNAADISLMAVTKTHPPERIQGAYEAGLRLFGENRVQEFSEKFEALRDLKDAQWHMIGHLQSNKAAKAAELFTGIDSVDSLKLAQRLNSSAEQLGKKLSVLIEVNVGGESAKSGVPPDSEELQELLHGAAALEYLEFRGLMTVPPFTENPEEARPYFRHLRQLRDEIAHRNLPKINMDVLSMGMSHDFEVAIEEGSTCVRVGTAIFGDRPA